jgi:putative membrane protein
MHYRARLMPPCFLAWYLLFSVWMADAPVDPQFWMLANILPVCLVGFLAATYRTFPLSNLSYGLITLFLTLHTIGAHYTYAQVPVGYWVETALALSRNPFDRVVHFSFGLLLTYPLFEVLIRFLSLSGFVSYYLSVMTPLGLSGLWEILESLVAQTVSPEQGIEYLGSQGDIWDAQQDIAAALYGALLCLLLTMTIRKILQRDVQPL